MIGAAAGVPGWSGLRSDHTRYDIENRLLEASKNDAVLYGYGADNRRIFESKRGSVHSNGDDIEEFVTFWSGQRIGRYNIRWDASPITFVFTRLEENVYFGSKPIRLGNPSAPETNVAVDRLGSIRRGNKDYFPYGQENPTTTAGDKEKYATYKHDAATDLSYADQRYYATGAGRFMSADPYRASAGAGDPGSWNRYAYVGGDPVNVTDPEGLVTCNETAHMTGAYLEAIVYKVSCYGRLFYDPDIVIYSNETNVSEMMAAKARSIGTASYATGSVPYWQAAAAKAEGALAWLSDARLGSTECVSVLNKLGVNAEDVRARAATVKIANASTSEMGMQTVVNTDSSESVAQYFDNRSDLTTLASIKTNTLFLDLKSWAGRTDEQAFGAALHETLHLLGVTHEAIGKIYGATYNTAEYSDKLGKDCGWW